MADNFDLLPFHNDFQLVNSASSYTSLVSQYINSRSGYTTLAAVGTSTTYSTDLKVTGYVYLQGFITHTFEDTVGIADSILLNDTRTFTDLAPLADSLNNGFTQLAEQAPISDTLDIQVVLTLEDTIPALDSLASIKSFEEFSPIADSLDITLVKTFTEYLSSTDSAEAFMYVDQGDSVVVGVIQQVQYDDQVLISVSNPMDFSDSVNLAVLPNSFPLTTNASSVTNPFLPTIIVDGTIYTYNASTAPTTYNSTTNFVNYLPAGIGGITLCDVYDYSLNLDTSGGTWSILANAPLGALGASVNVFGMTGTVTNVGWESSSSGAGYRSQGIFGNELLSRPMNMFSWGTPGLYTLLTNPRGGQTSEQAFGTYAGAAYAIATRIGANLSWAINDFPYIDTFPQEGGSTGDALASIIASIGGSLRWDGGNNYSAVYPTQSTGVFSIPNSGLITAAKYDNIYNITTGTAGVGSFGFSTYTNNLALTTDLPATTIPADQFQVQPIITNSKALTVNDPPIIANVPPDSVEAYIQILVNEGQSGTGAAYVTTDPNQWFSLSGPGIANPYFRPDYGLAKSYQLKLYCDYTLFPNLAVINNGNFVLRIGVRRYDPAAEYAAAKALRDAQIRNQIAKTVGQMRYVKGYDATVSCQFFGGIPLPGMRLQDVSLCGNIVEGGVIQSVSLASPGTLTINASKFATINYHANLSSFSLQDVRG